MECSRRDVKISRADVGRVRADDYRLPCVSSHRPGAHALHASSLPVQRALPSACSFDTSTDGGGVGAGVARGEERECDGWHVDVESMRSASGPYNRARYFATSAMGQMHGCVGSQACQQGHGFNPSSPRTCAPSIANIRSFVTRPLPPENPPSLPFAARTRWQGMTIGNGLRPSA